MLRSLYSLDLRNQLYDSIRSTSTLPIAKLSFIEYISFLIERSNLRYNRFLDYLTKVAKQANNTISLYYSIGRLALFTQQYAFSYLLGIRVVSSPYITLYQQYDSIIYLLLQNSKRFKANTIYTKGFLNRLGKQYLVNFSRTYVSY